jgi:hypothetical protein
MRSLLYTFIQGLIKRDDRKDYEKEQWNCLNAKIKMKDYSVIMVIVPVAIASLVVISWALRPEERRLSDLRTQRIHPHR